MAIVQCEKCGLKLSRTKRNYVAKVTPHGYPNTAVICGLSNCENPGMVWLEDHEYEDYKNGYRNFRIPSFAVKIKVESEMQLKGWGIIGIRSIMSMIFLI